MEVLTEQLHIHSLGWGFVYTHTHRHTHTQRERELIPFSVYVFLLLSVLDCKLLQGSTWNLPIFTSLRIANIVPCLTSILSEINHKDSEDEDNNVAGLYVWLHCTKAPAELTSGIQPICTKPYTLALEETVLYLILSPGKDIILYFIHLDRP